MNVGLVPAPPSLRDADAPGPSPRDEHLDAVKGVLIVLMVYGHVVHLGSLAALQTDLTRDVYSFHMQVFVILSGYLFHPRLVGRPILQPVLRRLVVPYLVSETLFLAGLTAAVTAGIATTTRAPAGLLDAVAAVVVHPTGPPWFLHALIVLQLGLALARWIAARTPFRHVAFAVVAVLLLGALTQFGYLKRWAAVSFFAGLALAALRAGDHRRLATLIAMVAGATLFVRGTPVAFTVKRLCWDLFVLGALSAGARIVPRGIRGSVAALGRRSLVVVVFHSFVLVATKPLAPLAIAVEPSGLMWSALTTAAGITGSLAAARVVDALGLAPWLFGVERTLRPRAGPAG